MVFSNDFGNDLPNLRVAGRPSQTIFFRIVQPEFEAELHVKVSCCKVLTCSHVTTSYARKTADVSCVGPVPQQLTCSSLTCRKDVGDFCGFGNHRLFSAVVTIPDGGLD